MTTKTKRGLLVVPANNTTMEPEMNALCPEFGPFAVARVPRPPRLLVNEDLPAYGKSTLAAVDPFRDLHPDLVVYGCTAAGFLAGPSGNQRMVEALKDHVGCSVVSTAGAMVDTLLDAGIKNVALLTPYLQPVNDSLKAYLESSRIGVEVVDSFFCQSTAALGEITEEQVYDKAIETVTPRSEALFIACSQLPTLGIVDKLRDRLGIPVWSSLRATAYAASHAVEH